MKKLLFIILISLFSLNVFSQGLNFKQKVNPNDLIGYWKPDQESSQLFFWKDTKGVLQVQDICGSTGEPLKLIEFKVNQDSVLLKEILVENNWVTVSVFTFINKTTLKRVVDGNINVTITYTKIK